MKASAMLGISVDTLLNLQKGYDKKRIEIARAKEMDEQIAIAKDIDYRYFVKNKFLPDVKTKEEEVTQLCSFLKVGNLRILLRKDLAADFRTTVETVTDKNIINANVWVQTALNEGLAMDVAPFDQKKLKSYVGEMRAMSVQESETFLPRLREIFKECGVAFVILPALKNCGVNGVVKWYNDKVVLALNDRFKYEDSFWLSLFHEIKHVLQKKRTKVLVSSEEDLLGVDRELEDEADRYASVVLIPQGPYDAFLCEKGKCISKVDVTCFANRIGVHPGIVVGRLQRDERIPHSQMTDMRKRFSIDVG